MQNKRQNTKDFSLYLKSVNPALLGFGLIYAWFGSLFSGLLPLGSTQNLMLPFDGGMCLVYVAFICAGKHSLSTTIVRRISAIGSALSLAGAVLYAIFSFIDFANNTATCIVAFVCGMGFAATTSVWKALYCSFGPAQVVILYCGSKLLSDLIIIALAGYNTLYYATCSALIAALGCILLWRALSYETVPHWPCYCKDIGESRMWKLVLLCIVYGLAYGFCMRGVPSGGMPVTVADGAACCAIVCALLFWNKFDAVLLYRFAFPILIVGCMAVPAFPGVPTLISHMLLRISYTAVLIYTTVVICNLCRKQGYNPFVAFSVNALAVHGAIRCGEWIEIILMGPIDTQWGGAVSTCLVSAAAITTAIMLSERSLGYSWGVDGASGRRDALLTSHIIAIWHERFGLTPRESELLGYLVSGSSINDIASELFISQGTVKAHIQHIYRKTGVHSREELLGRFKEEAFGKTPHEDK